MTAFRCTDTGFETIFPLETSTVNLASTWERMLLKCSNTCITFSLQGSRMFGTPGFGGQMVYGDVEHKIGFAFLTNRLYSGLNPFSPQFKALLNATYDIVEKIK